MRLIRIEAEGLLNFKDQLVIDFFAEQRVNADNTEMLFRPFGKIFTNNVISVVGINAAGKTSLLKVIALSINLLNGESINSIRYKDILSKKKETKFSFIFYEKGNLYKLTSGIRYENNDPLNYRYIFTKENLYIKSVKKITTKKNLIEFDNNNLQMVRDNSAEFLKEDISIMISMNKSSRLGMLNLMDITDTNRFISFSDVPMELVKFLDPSIETLSFDKETGKGVLIFKGREPINILKIEDLNEYLSSGTIKGITTFACAMVILQYGGYLIVDELENHFNREIVATLIRFFMNERVNPYGATLIYSTHYSEILDEFERNDSIYIVRNDNGIQAQKLNHILKRNDIKKSEAFKSDYLQGTVPSYDTYIDLKNIVIQRNKQEV